MQQAEASKKKVLKVQMLGKFRITLDDREIKLPGNSYSKTTYLFLLIAYYGEQGISREDVLEFLYGDGEYADHSGNLRVTSHRLKKQLAEAGVLSEKGSISKKGKFGLSQEGLEIVVDAKVFQEAARTAMDAHCEADEELLLEQACKLYTGEFLPSMAAELWAAGKQASYQNLYFRCVRQYLALLARTGQYENMLSAARDTLRMYPYEEWYVAEIDALIGLGRWKEAQETAQCSAKSLMDRMGVHPSREMMDRMKKINGQLQGSAKNLVEICRELEEPGGDSGAYCCSYQSFAGAYRYEMRRIERTGESMYLILCSMTEREVRYPAAEDGLFDTAVEQLGKAIGQALRRADIYTRYGSNQYLMLLGSLKQEDCAIISSRIQRIFDRNPGSGRFELHHYITPVTGKDLQSPRETVPAFKFGQKGWRMV